MYAAVLLIGVKNASSVQPVVAVERTVFYRERAAGMYSALPYAFAQVLIELPYVLVQAVFYSIIDYAMIGFEWTAAEFFWCLFFMYFTFLERMKLITADEICGSQLTGLTYTSLQTSYIANISLVVT
eukprot:XP_025983822.1 pleiotropic drug resistance protein 1-like [Glycine max]